MKLNGWPEDEQNENETSLMNHNDGWMFLLVHAYRASLQLNITYHVRDERKKIEMIHITFCASDDYFDEK